MRLLLLLFGVLATGASQAYGQTVSPLTCVDFEGRLVTTTDAPNPSVSGAVRMLDGQPVIFLNRHALSGSPAVLQLFWYAHECAHHVLGHEEVVTTHQEASADCWAVRTGRELGWFVAGRFATLIGVLSRSSPSSWKHMPDEARINRIRQCYGAPE